MLYGIFRIIVEFIREPDNHLGYIFGDFLTNGILLSVPMIVVGLIVFIKVNEKYRTSVKK